MFSRPMYSYLPQALECQQSICCPTVAPTVALETLEWVIPPEDDV